MIFANGEMKDHLPIEAKNQPVDIIIAADGGSTNCLKLGLRPDVLIGDLDSLTHDQVLSLESTGTKILRFPARKDYTDLELAVQYAIQAGSQDILILGALGQRWDQTLANLLLPAATSYISARIRIIDGQQEITLVQSGQTLVVHGHPGDTFSLIPLSGDASGITTQGLEYPLQDETLLFGATRGISNELTGDTAQVYLAQGMLLAVLIHQPFQEGNL
jgi:thiamine pyrophosphokinase